MKESYVFVKLKRNMLLMIFIGCFCHNSLSWMGDYIENIREKSSNRGGISIEQYRLNKYANKRTERQDK